jgi:hypothetical protein
VNLHELRKWLSKRELDEWLTLAGKSYMSLKDLTRLQHLSLLAAERKERHRDKDHDSEDL